MPNVCSIAVPEVFAPNLQPSFNHPDRDDWEKDPDGWHARLGSGGRRGFSGLEMFPVARSSALKHVVFETSEFTSLCPVTQQADFASVSIAVVPEGYAVETRTLKEYLATFRNVAAFNEDIASSIASYISEALRAARVTVVMRFAPRGGIAPTVTAEVDREETETTDGLDALLSNDNLNIRTLGPEDDDD